MLLHKNIISLVDKIIYTAILLFLLQNIIFYVSEYIFYKLSLIFGMSLSYITLLPQHNTK